MLVFMLNWYEKFPDFKSRELFLTGESYAGHYIPQLAIALLDYNAHSTGFKFNIKGVAIGIPLPRLDRDVPATYEFFWSHGMISDEVGLTTMNKCDFDDYVFASPHNQTDTCNNAINESSNIVGTYNYDVILDICYPSIAEEELRLRKVQAQVPPTSLPVSNSLTTGDTWFGRKALASDIPSLHRVLLKGYSQPSALNPDTYIPASTSSSTNHKTTHAPLLEFPFQRRKLLKGYTQPSAPNPNTYIPASTSSSTNHKVAPTPLPKFPLLRQKLLKGYTRPSTPNPATYIPASTNHKAAPAPLPEFSLLRRKLLRGYTLPSASSSNTYIPASVSTLANHKTALAPSPN